MGDANDAFMRSQAANSVQARPKAQNRASVLQLKLIGQSHPTGLTPNLLKLFEPRSPLEFRPPPEKRKCAPYTGMAQFVSRFAEPGDPEYAPPVQEAETPAQKKARINMLRLEKGAAKVAEELPNYDPSKDPNATGDPYKTLFVARLNYETTEHRIKREFESYGPIKRVCLITDRETNKPRGYAFVEYMHTRDMKTAYKQADGRKLDNRRVLVDVERGRTVANWRPRRLGGGLGSTRIGGEDLNQKCSGREPQQLASGGRRSEEPRARDDREREKSRDRGRDRDREREKSREQSSDRLRDRDSREDRHHRDRDRTRERERDREVRDRGGRDRGRDRDRDKDRGRDYDRGRDRRERDRERERDYEHGSHEGSRAREKHTTDYDSVEQKHIYDHAGEREKDNYDYEPEPGQLIEEPGDDAYRGISKPEHEHGEMEPDGYRGHYDRDYEHRRSERSHSREYDH